MEIEIKVASSNYNGFNTFKLNFDVNDTIGDIKNEITNNNNVNIDNKHDIVLCHINSGLIFQDNNIGMTQIIKELNINDNIITFNVMRNMNNNNNNNNNKQSESHKLRLKNEAHVHARRQSRVMIVKSKISSEIQRESRKMVLYKIMDDSPFFWSCINESENRIKRLSLRLEKICDSILDLCSITITFSEHCGRIHNLVKKSWEDVEKQYSSDIISLSSIFNELGEQFAHMCNASKQLAVTLKAVLVDAFRDFTEEHLSNVSISSKQLIILEKEYENSLRKLLHSSQNLPKINPKKSSKNASKNQKITDLEQYEEWKNKIIELKKNYELARFDHVNILNSVINRHRYSLCLSLCACFSAFETFFHVGYEASLGNKVFHRSIQMGISQKTLNEDKNDKKLNKIRNEIENKLNKLNKNDEKKNENENENENEKYSKDKYSGYLWKQSSNMKKDWKRRWFVLENGELGYYRSKDKLEREFVVNTMLCKVKERLDHDYRYVFELISPSRRIYVLQAQSNKDYITWCNILRNQVHRLLRKNTSRDTYDNDNDNNTNNYREQKRELKRIIQETNGICADCNKKDPEWVSINTGVIICIDCAGIHRGLGTHISKIRSLILDDINESVLKCLIELGNNNINKILQHTIPSDYSIISYQSNTNEKEKYIKGKYMFKMFINPIQNSQQKIYNLLRDGAINNNLLDIFKALCYGVNIDYQFQNHSNKTALHETSLHNYIQATEFLLQNGANQNIEDDNGKLPRELAEDNQSNQVLSILEYHVDTLQYTKHKDKKQKSPPSNNETK